MKQEEINRIKWYHCFDYGNGLRTPNYDSYIDYQTRQLNAMRLPDSLANKTCLDLGAWDGFYSFEMEKRGGDVTALDKNVWDRGFKEGFDFNKKHFASSVKEINMDIMDITPEKIGTYDIVNFCGIIYHMKNPWLGIEVVSKVVKEVLILETFVSGVVQKIKEPAIVLYGSNQLQNVHSNWTAPNYAAIEVMLKDVGFNEIERTDPASPIIGGHRAVWRAKKC